MRHKLFTIALVAGLIFCLPAQAIILDEEPPKPVAKPLGKSRMELENERMKKELQALKRKQQQKDKPMDDSMLIEQETQKSENTNLVKQAIENTFPIAIVPFAMQGVPVDISDVVDSDLKRSNYFKTLDKQNMPDRPTTADAVQFNDWQALGQKYLVIGQVTEEHGQYNIQFHLFDVYKFEHLMGYQIASSEGDLRRTAHHISNLIFEKLTGKKGEFNRRIAYITRSSQGKHDIQVSDQDGYNAQTVVSSEEPLMTPVISPDGRKIAYVSFEGKSAVVYIQTLATGAREKVAKLPGSDDSSLW